MSLSGDRTPAVFFAASKIWSLRMLNATLTPTTQLDFPTIAEWAVVDVDDSHRKIPNEFWLTGQGYFSGKVEDAEGITLFFRFNREDESILRMHTQFAPEN